MDRCAIGKKIKELRGDMPVDEFAKEIDISPSAVRMYESGERIPRDEIKLKIARYFGKSIEEIFFAQQLHK